MRTLSLLATLVLVVTLQAQSGQYHRVRVHLAGMPDGLRALGELGIPVDHGAHRPGVWFESDLNETELGWARAAGFPVEVLIEDVSAHYRAQNTGETDRSGAGQRDACNNELFFPVPTNFQLGSMAGYYTWEEMLDELDAMRAQYPQLITAKESIGQSHEGRPIHFVRISNDPEVDQDKPEVLYDALHHAREPASLSQLIFFMWYLLENYGSDPEVDYLVNNLELYFVPCLNPDGYVYNQTIEPGGGGLWRKNRRVNGDGSFGVDLNRNYGFGWGVNNSGSSPNPASDVYRGPAPFSEPETQAIRDFCEAHEFRLAQNHHTFGNLLIYPWGYQDSFYTPDSALYANYGALLTRENRFAFGTADQTVNYTVNGGSDDWMYGEQATKPRIMAMTPESGKEEEAFWPPAARITAICQAGMPLNLNTAHLAGRYAEARDLTPYSVAVDGADIAFRITRLGLEPGDFTVSLEGLENVAAVGEPVIFQGMEILEERFGSIAILPNVPTTSSATLRFVLAVNNGAYTYRDTITKVIGPAVIQFTDPGTNLGNWTGNWGLSNNTWFSPPSSITDSPFGNYANNANTSIRTTQPVDLGNFTAARLTFMARWDIEPAYDHVQLQGSSNGSSWVPLCGRHTRPGSIYQDEGEPIYDGVRNVWVEEEVDLAAFLGGPVFFRFVLRSDDFSTGDGFYFDDFTVTGTEPLVTGLGDPTAASGFSLHPNPATSGAWITWHKQAMPMQEIRVQNALGAVVRTIPIQAAEGTVHLNCSELPAGVYHLTLIGQGQQQAGARLLVVR